MPTSEATRAQARQLGIALTTLDETPELDLTVDGADEIAPDLTLIKGGGGALLREKIVAAASAKMIVIADEIEMGLDCSAASRCRSKSRRSALRQRTVRSRAASPTWAVPGRPLVRKAQDGHAFVTDGGHWLLDAQLLRIADPQALAARLCAVPGVMEHGLFIGLARTAILAGPDGVRLVERP